ncbi:hypothetical protein PFISCL1PPCAC_23895, partial [Pristionchus fissidentatus]
MAEFIFYRDGKEEKGPFDEEKILHLYNTAEFTSDVAFQIRSSLSDASAPFITLRDLIWKNGPANPFRDEFKDIDKRVAEKEEELAVLKGIANKKEELERRVAEIEKKLEEKMKMNNSKTQPKSSDDKENANKKTDPLANLRGFEGLNIKQVEKFSMDNDKHALHYRQSLHHTFETTPLSMCTTCDLMLANFKQYLVHTTKSSCPVFSKEGHDTFQPDFDRWNKEDECRAAMGRRLFDKMRPDEIGSSRPQTDFMEDMHLKLKKEMKLDSDAGRAQAMEYLDSDAAKKVKERLEEHLREAKGKLVCSSCKVACKNHVHFVIHLTTYDHRMKVKGTALELISLLLGWFNRGCYLKEADPSELDEDIDADPHLSLEMNATVWQKGEVSAAPSEESFNEEVVMRMERDRTQDESHNGMKDLLMNDCASRVILSCIVCNAMYTNFKQFLVHIGSEQHKENVGKVVQPASEVSDDERGHEQFLAMFESDLQRWRWEDRARLTSGKKMYEEWSEEEKKE